MIQSSSWYLLYDQSTVSVKDKTLIVGNEQYELPSSSVSSIYISYNGILFLIGCTIYYLVVFNGTSSFRKVSEVPSLRSVNSPNIFSLNGKVFVFSGISTVSRMTLVQMFSLAERFRVRRICGPLPPPRAGATCCEFNNEIVMAGGLHTSATDESFCSDVWAFNGKTWRQLEIVGPCPICVHAMCRVMCDRIVVYGGYNGKTTCGLVYNDFIWLLDPVNLRAGSLQTWVRQDKFKPQKFYFYGFTLLIDDERVDISALFEKET